MTYTTTLSRVEELRKENERLRKERDNAVAAAEQLHDHFCNAQDRLKEALNSRDAAVRLLYTALRYGGLR